MSDYYDRDGNPITLEQWRWLFERGEDYRRVATVEVAGCWVSTVWLGLDHNFGFGGPPHIFETMAFIGARNGDSTDDIVMRTSTEEEAHEAHARVVDQVKVLLAAQEVVDGASIEEQE